MKSIFRWLAVGLAGCALGAGTLRADEALRRVQQSLRDQGFYFGTVDGAPGDATTQAVRRYQIRNGLPVSGELDDETRRRIEQNGRAVPPVASGGGGSGISVRPAPTPERTVAPTPAYQRPTVRPVPDEEPTERETTRPDLRVGPGGPPPADLKEERGLPNNAVLPSARLSALFAGTPYEFAPPPVQADVVRKAQAGLTRQGFYDGAVDGVPNGVLGEALTNFQGVNRLRKTGRLDVSTLGLMRLLPGRQTVAPRDRRDDDDEPRQRPNIIFEGKIMR